MITKILGDVPVIKILDFLQKSIPHDFTKTEIEKGADVGYTELRRDFECMTRSNMVIETRRIGGVQLYTLNPDQMIVAAVMDFCKVISVADPALPLDKAVSPTDVADQSSLQDNPSRDEEGAIKGIQDDTDQAVLQEDLDELILPDGPTMLTER